MCKHHTVFHKGNRVRAGRILCEVQGARHGKTDITYSHSFVEAKQVNLIARTVEERSELLGQGGRKGDRGRLDNGNQNTVTQEGYTLILCSTVG